MIGRGMRQSTIQFMIIALLAVLLPILAFMQFSWLNQLSVWEKERIEASISNNTSRFSEDFDRELSFLYRSFWMQLTPDADIRRVLFRHYYAWSKSAKNPGLIDAVHVYFPENGQYSGLQRYFPGSKVFIAEEEWPQDLVQIRTYIDKPYRYLLENSILVREGNGPVLIVPFNRLVNDGSSYKMSPQFGIVILELDQTIILERIIPRMIQDYFEPAEIDAFDITITTFDDRQILYSTDSGRPGGDGNGPDVKERFFTIHNRDQQGISWIPADRGESGTDGFSMSMPALTNYSGEEINNDSYRRSMYLFESDQYAGDMALDVGEADSVAPSEQDGRQAEAEQLDPGIWQITAIHKSGSVEQAIADGRFRNTLIVLGTMILLALSAGVLVFSARRARRLARQQMEFVAGVTHELRTPLAIIRSAGDNLADDVISDSSQLQRYGRLIENQGRRLSEMIEKILLYSRLQSSHEDYRFDEIEPREFIESAVRDSNRIASQYGVQLNAHLADNLPVIRGDKEALKSAVSNILSNAVKYGHSKKPIELLAVERNGGDGNTVAIVIKDSGRGISADELADIFKPFYRGEGARNTNTEGSGLGLSLVKQIIDAHEGRITVESKLNLGSTFTIVLPVDSQSGATDEKKDITN